MYWPAGTSCQPVQHDDRNEVDLVQQVIFDMSHSHWIQCANHQLIFSFSLLLVTVIVTELHKISEHNQSLVMQTVENRVPHN